MKTVKTIMDEATYQALVKMKKAAGMPSVSALFLDRCGVLGEHAEANEITRRALHRAKKRTDGAEYRLCDLFPTDWATFSKGARLRAGKLFNGEVASATHGIRATRKSSSGHQFYVTASGIA